MNHLSDFPLSQLGILLDCFSNTQEMPFEHVGKAGSTHHRLAQITESLDFVRSSLSTRFGSAKPHLAGENLLKTFCCAYLGTVASDCSLCLTLLAHRLARSTSSRSSLYEAQRRDCQFCLRHLSFSGNLLKSSRENANCSPTSEAILLWQISFELQCLTMSCSVEHLFAAWSCSSCLWNLSLLWTPCHWSSSSPSQLPVDWRILLSLAPDSSGIQ